MHAHKVLLLTTLVVLSVLAVVAMMAFARDPPASLPADPLTYLVDDTGTVRMLGGPAPYEDERDFVYVPGADGGAVYVPANDTTLPVVS